MLLPTPPTHSLLQHFPIRLAVDCCVLHFSSVLYFPNETHRMHLTFRLCLFWGFLFSSPRAGRFFTHIPRSVLSLCWSLRSPNMKYEYGNNPDFSIQYSCSRRRKNRASYGRRISFLNTENVNNLSLYSSMKNFECCLRTPLFLSWSRSPWRKRRHFRNENRLSLQNHCTIVTTQLQRLCMIFPGRKTTINHLKDLFFTLAPFVSRRLFLSAPFSAIRTSFLNLSSLTPFFMISIWLIVVFDWAGRAKIWLLYWTFSIATTCFLMTLQLQKLNENKPFQQSLASDTSTSV